ncbi:18S rRNA (guanine1575-N7)-methyltransferase [Mitosporidium daphniae]
MGGQRPELTGPPELFYSEAEAKKYSQSSRYAKIQRELAFRAYELLALPSLDGNDQEEDEPRSLFNPKPCIPSLLLDIGVGSGMCASVLGENNHAWIGLDISVPMLHVAKSRLLHPNKEAEQEPADCESQEGQEFEIENEDTRTELDDESDSEGSENNYSDASDCSDDSYDKESDNQHQNGDLVLGDMGDGLGFRAGSFDGAISVSALQWLCNADTREASPKLRLRRLFSSLYSTLRIGARAVFQFYPENAAQIEMILNVALKVGFNGGMVVDFPNAPRRKKYFLVLIVGQASLPKGKDDTPLRQIRHRRKKNLKDKAWVLRKKDLRRKRGFEDVPQDTKYTARKRGPRF